MKFSVYIAVVIAHSVKFDNWDTPDDKLTFDHLFADVLYCKSWESKTLLEMLTSTIKLLNDDKLLFKLGVWIVVIPEKVPPGDVKTDHGVPFVEYSIKFPFVIFIIYWLTLIAKTLPEWFSVLLNVHDVKFDE